MSDLSEVRARARAADELASRATPGPWTTRGVSLRAEDGPVGGTPLANFYDHEADPEFCAAARELVPQLAQDAEALADEVERLREDYIAHRLAAAILVGTLAHKQPEVLDWACKPGQQPEHVAAATRQIVADARRYDNGTAVTLEPELRAALTPEQKGGGA